VTAPIPADITAYNAAQAPAAAAVCARLATAIASGLPEATAKVWHGGPVWFLQDNPVAGYWVRKAGVQLLFWSGQSFRTPGLRPEGKFKAAEANCPDAASIDSPRLADWLAEARVIQWDYRNIVKRKGVLLPLGDWAT
jgi:hypothetical protein